jgi:hypothetical protein
MVIHFSLKAIAAGLVASLASATSAVAADSVLIQYQDRERTITTENLEIFAETGKAVSEDIQAFFDENPEVAGFANEVITTEISISPAFLERLNESAFGEFVLIQFNKVLGTPSGNEDLEPIRTALADSLKDNSFSVLEIVQNYPGDIIRLDFSELQPVVNDIKVFIEKVEPALQVAREFLQDIVCDCETPEPLPAEEASVEPSTSAANTDDAIPSDSEGQPFQGGFNEV